MMFLFCRKAKPGGQQDERRNQDQGTRHQVQEAEDQRAGVHGLRVGQRLAVPSVPTEDGTRGRIRGTLRTVKSLQPLPKGSG